MKPRKYTAPIAAAVISVFFLSAPAIGKTMVDLGKSSSKVVNFSAVGKPSFLKIEGKSEALAGVLTKDGGAFSGQAELDLTTLDTGIDLRNEHMKDKYLDVKKFPKATLTIKKLPWGAGDGTTFTEIEGAFEGELTLHGVTKPVSGSAMLTGTGTSIKAHVEFKTQISDYGIDTPSFKGVTVADSVTVSIDLTAPVQKP